VQITFEGPQKPLKKRRTWGGSDGAARDDSREEVPRKSSNVGGERRKIDGKKSRVEGRGKSQKRKIRTKNPGKRGGSEATEEKLKDPINRLVHRKKTGH